LQQLISVSPERAKDLALLLVNNPEGSKLNIFQTVDIFMRSNDVKSTTNILLEYLKPRGDKAEDAVLQTRLLEINLLSNPQVFEAIMDSDDYKFSHYDKPRIAVLCERAQLYQRALEHYTDLADIKRVLTNASLINPEFLLEYFGRMTPENCLELLRDLLKFNQQLNIRLVVEVAKKWSDYLTPDALIQMFEEFKSYTGIFFYLSNFVNTTQDPKVVFKFIEAATNCQQLKEVERVCRDNTHYEAKEVKEYLLSQNLKDPRPLIHVCDRFGYVDELTQYLYTNNMYVFIEAYVTRMNVKACPEVLGALLDMNANEEQIRKLVDNVRPPPDDPTFVDKLVSSVEKRNRLKLLRKFLEDRSSEGSDDIYVHNGLAKIYVDLNNNPQTFLINNKFYDSAVVGAYCESRDPHLAFVAYKRAGGACDDQLIAVTNKNGFFKDQARYLVERQDAELWAKVLDESNTFKRQLIDQVVATALPESKVPEEVSNTVKAFMAANLPNELIELLERIILHGANSEFNNNRNLQNLLILTAIKADKKRVMDYIKRLENYDGPDIAKIAISDQYKLYEEAFFIYKKFKKGPEAIGVLLDNLEDIPRALEFAEYLDQSDVWSILGRAQLGAGQIKEAIQAFQKADDATAYLEVIAAAKRATFFVELIDFIKMARSKLKDSAIDGELIYCYAKTNKLAELEEFINGSHIAKIGECGDRCFNEQLYHAAKILFNHINNNAKMAICLVMLNLFQEAVNAAQKANAIPTWKAVCFACVNAKEFRLAQMCAINIIVYMDHLNELISHYERQGFFDELIAVLEQGINLDRAHQGIYTQLGVAYCKYKEEKIMEHIKLFWSRLNIPTLLGACQENLHWAECVFLYSHYDQYDNAVDMLVTHSAECWSHDLFKATLKQVANVEIYYKGVDFYLSEHPLLTNDLLLDLVSQLDASRVVNMIKPTGKLPLIQKYLLHVQFQNKREVNDAINKLHIEDGNHKALKKSVDEFNEFDLIALATQLENHALLEFRRISAYLFKVGKKWERAMVISKKDNLWSDTMETTADSGSPEMAEELLTYFVKEDKKECFAACLYVCFELIRVDVVLELAWRHGLVDFAMPFMIQAFRDFDTQIKQLNSKFKSQEDATRTEEEKKKKSDEEEQRGAASYVGISGNFNPLIMPLALPQPGASYGAPVGNFAPSGHFGPPGNFGPGNFAPPGAFGGPMGFSKFS
jgi:clathrin heavy chain